MPYKDPDRQRQFAREWVAARRAEFFKDKKCVECGSTENMELDHIDPALKVSHKIWSWSAVRREAEIAKCQVLCKECHKAKTLLMLPVSHHGSPGRYGHQKCRCGLCKLQHRNRMRDWRAGRRAA